MNKNKMSFNQLFEEVKELKKEHIEVNLDNIEVLLDTKNINNYTNILNKFMDSLSIINDYIGVLDLNNCYNSKLKDFYKVEDIDENSVEMVLKTSYGKDKLYMYITLVTDSDSMFYIRNIKIESRNEKYTYTIYDGTVKHLSELEDGYINIYKNTILKKNYASIVDTDSIFYLIDSLFKINEYIMDNIYYYHVQDTLKQFVKANKGKFSYTSSRNFKVVYQYHTFYVKVINDGDFARITLDNDNAYKYVDIYRNSVDDGLNFATLERGFEYLISRKNIKFKTEDEYYLLMLLDKFKGDKSNLEILLETHNSKDSPNVYNLVSQDGFIITLNYLGVFTIMLRDVAYETTTNVNKVANIIRGIKELNN